MEYRTEEFATMKAAEATFAADSSMVSIDRLEAAERAYFGKLAAARAKFAAMPLTANQRYDSEQNATETEGTAEDELYWVEVAIGTGQMYLDYPNEF